MYRFIEDTRELSEVLVDTYSRLSSYMMGLAPPVFVHNRKQPVYRWVAVGRKYYHPVYVSHMYNRKREAFGFETKPPYLNYALAVMGLYVNLGLHPVGLILLQKGEKPKSILGLVVPDREQAIELLTKILDSPVIVISPIRLSNVDLSFEGYLYKLPFGFVTVENKKQLEEYDVIDYHIEGNKILEEEVLELGKIFGL